MRKTPFTKYIKQVKNMKTINDNHVLDTTLPSLIPFSKIIESKQNEMKKIANIFRRLE